MKRNSSSRPTSSHSPTRFPRAQLRVIASNGRQLPPRDVRLALCHNVFWIPLEKEEKDAPRSLYDFRNANSLELTRRTGDAVTWDDIVNDIKPLTTCNLSFVVPGRLHGKERLTKLSGNVKIVITASTPAERDAWLYTIRMRVCSWQVLRQRAKELMGTGEGSVSMDILTSRMEAMCVTTVGGQNVDDLTEVPSKYSRKGSSSKSRAASISERVYSGTQKTDWVEKFNTQLSGLTGIIASAIEKAAKAVEKSNEATERIAGTAKDVADFAKFVPGGAGAVFQLVAVSARLAVMYAEANRGCWELPKLLPKIVELLVCVSRNVASILHATDEENLNDTIFEEYVFEVLVSTLDLLGTVETQLMRSKWGQLINSGVVKEVEASLSMLKTKVVSVALTEGVKGIRGDVTTVQKNVNTANSRITSVESRVEVLELASNTNLLSIGQHLRPEVSPHFVGRRPELQLLRKTLEKYGSAAITGLGGLGKTQLMAAFADRIYRDENSHRVVHWVTADGDACDIVASFASLIEHLSRCVIPAQDRNNPRFILTALRNILSKAGTNWLLCIDNVDGAGKSDVKSLLNEAVSMTGNDGWVIVTSRTGSPKLWSRMKQDQNLQLQRLSEEDAALLLWRMKESLDTTDASDDRINEQVLVFEKANAVESQALRELCGSEWQYSLDGLPLALIQAGAYIRNRGCSFSKYLQVYKDSNEKDKLCHMMRESEEFSPVRPEQRAILSTWKISVDVLSKEAFSVLRAASMLGTALIPEYLLKSILKDVVNVSEEELEAQYSKVVLDELAFKSSLVQRMKMGSVDYFGMHRLVRLFLLVDMGERSGVLDVAFNRALCSTHSCLASRLESNGLSVWYFPRGEDTQGAFVSHTHALVGHYQNERTCEHESKLADIFFFTGKHLRWACLMKDAENVFQSLLGLLYKIHGTDAKHPSIADVFCHLGFVYGIFDFHELFTTRYHGPVFQRDKRKNELHCPEKAQLMFQKDLEMRYQIHGRDGKHLSIADALCRLGRAYERSGKFELAESMYDQEQRMRCAVSESEANRPSVESASRNLDSICDMQGNPEKSEAMQKRNPEMKRVIQGEGKCEEVQVLLAEIPNLTLPTGSHRYVPEAP